MESSTEIHPLRKQQNELFSDAPDRIRQLAEREALQYLLFEIDGVVIPAVTTAFWLDSEGLFIFDDSIDEFEQNGGEFICRLLGPFDELEEYLREYSDFSPEEAELAKHLYHMKIKKNMQITERDISGADKKSEGYAEFM